MVEAIVEATEGSPTSAKESLSAFQRRGAPCGDVPPGREEVEFFDFEVGDATSTLY